MKIGFNLHAEGLKDSARIIDWHRKAKPAWTLVMNGAGLIKDLRAASPQTNVIFRSYPPGGDETIWQRWTPEQWVANARQVSDGLGCWMYCLNEPGFGDNMLGWLCETIELAVKAGLKLVVGNFAVGTPEPSDWKKPAAVRLLALLDKYRQSVVLGLHEYACGVITSGFVGGPPTELKGKDGQVIHRDFIRPASWPGLDEARTTTMWHVGRVKFMLNACKGLGIPAPRVVITEHGFDSLKSDPNPDLRRWIDGLPHDMGEVRGWLTLRTYWNIVYPQWWHEQAYFEQLKYADQIVYAGLPVEGQMLYCYGHKDPMWETFDCEGYEFLLQLLADYSAATIPTPAPTPTPPPVVTPPAPTYPAFPPDFPARAIAGYLSSSYAANIRKQPTVLSEKVEKLTDEPIAGWIIYPDQLKPDETVNDEQSGLKGVWVPVRIKQANTNLVDGWVFGALLTFKLAPPPKPDGREAAVRNALNQVSTMRAILDAQQKLLEEALEEV